MSLTLMRVDGQVVITSDPDPVEEFTVELLQEPDLHSMTIADGRITIRDDNGRTLVFRIIGATSSAMAAELVSDTRPEAS